MRRTICIVVLALGAAISGARAQTPAPPLPILSVKDLMRRVLNPAADAYWALSGTVDTEDGVANRAPKDDAHWESRANSAAVVMQTGEALLAQGRIRDEAVWLKNARQMIEAGAAGMKAAQEKNVEAAFNAGSQMYDACFNCHARYIPRTRRNLAPLPD